MSLIQLNTLWPATAVIVAIAFPAAALSAQSAGHIASQPMRDIGLEKTKIPPLLEKVSDNPYSAEGTASCTQIKSSIGALTAVIGPDFSSSPAHNRQNYAGLGGTAIVDSLIPFRGIVREVSGASAADRRKAAAVDAGVARRGFLRGLLVARKCT